MSKQRNIVSFEDARRSAAKRAGIGVNGANAASVAAKSSDKVLGKASNKTLSLSSDSGSAQSNRLKDIFSMSDGFEMPAGADDIKAAVTSAPVGKEGFFEKRINARQRRKKAKAEKAFMRAYGGQATSASMEQAGPRAAVYKGQMGSKQRRANRIQEKESPAASMEAPSKKRSFDIGQFWTKHSKAISIVACLVLFVTLLYTPAQQYYQQMRERDRLAAEYSAIQQRNDALQGTVEALQSDAGIEDKAHSEFGYVKEGEQAVAVTGVNLDDTSSFTANVVPGTVPAPETWYSPFLDVLFGYSRTNV